MDEVEIVWAYCPHDREKQGTSEWLPRDVAREKVTSGLARYAPVKPAETEAPAEVQGSLEVSPEPEAAPEAVEAAPNPRRPRVPAQTEAPKAS